MTPRHRAFLALGLSACTSTAEPVEYVQLELHYADGVASDPAWLSEGPDWPAVAPQARGELRVQLVDADGNPQFVGYWPASRELLIEEFGGDRIEGERVRLDALDLVVQVPALDLPGGQLQTRLDWAPGQRLERSVAWDALRNDGGASTAPLVTRGDVGGRREALVDTCSSDSECGDMEWCSGRQCIPDVCPPTATWDASVAPLVHPTGANGRRRILFVPRDYATPGDFETQAQSVVDGLDRVNFFADHIDEYSFYAFRGDCTYQGSAPTDNLEFGNGLLGHTPGVTRNRPYRIVVLDGNGGCNGWTFLRGRTIQMGHCVPAGNTLAHELGHSVAGLEDEYPGGATEICDTGNFLDIPNISPSSRMKWACDFGGELCDPASGRSEIVSGYPLAGGCFNHFVPCPDSIMRASHSPTAYFDPVGYAAMLYSTLNDGVLRFGACDCDESCAAIDADHCGMNGCFGLCDRCNYAAGDACRMTSTAFGAPSFECRTGCPGSACLDAFYRDVCVGDFMLISDPSCSGSAGGVAVPLAMAVCTEDLAGRPRLTSRPDVSLGFECLGCADGSTPCSIPGDGGRVYTVCTGEQQAVRDTSCPPATPYTIYGCNAGSRTTVSSCVDAATACAGGCTRAGTTYCEGEIVCEPTATGSERQRCTSGSFHSVTHFASADCSGNEIYDDCQVLDATMTAVDVPQCTTADGTALCPGDTVCVADASCGGYQRNRCRYDASATTSSLMVDPECFADPDCSRVLSTATCPNPSTGLPHYVGERNCRQDGEQTDGNPCYRVFECTDTGWNNLSATGCFDDPLCYLMPDCGPGMRCRNGDGREVCPGETVCNDVGSGRRTRYRCLNDLTWAEAGGC